MSDDNIERLRHEQKNIHAAYGMWGTDELAAGCAAGAAVGGFGGDSGTVHDIAANVGKTHEIAMQAWHAVQDVLRMNVGESWVGDTHVAAAQAVTALFTDIHHLTAPMEQMPDHLRRYAECLERARPADAECIDQLNDVAGQAGKMTAWGFLPDLSEYDSRRMAELHAVAMQAIDGRVGTHEGVRDAGRQLASLLGDQAAGLRARRLRGSPMSALDDVVLAEAGNSVATADNGILTPAEEDRAAAALSGLGDADRQAMMSLLAGAASPEQRAYLLKALAAGYSLDDVTRFDSMIAAHGDDPAWLAQHLNPLAMDSSGRGVWYNHQPNNFEGQDWTQGPHPTCVASSTVAARAAVDPLYALELTTGGHPGDPAFDNGDAFAKRLLAEQTSVYDNGRDWMDKLPLVGIDGMSDDQSTTIANEQIGAHTGASYANVDMADADARSGTIPQIEKAVDDGYPVPISTRGGGEGHQMMIIGHAGDQLEIYNPWGYTYWVSEDSFGRGDIAEGTPGLPGTPVSVRLPQGVK
ncbi:hypothetical protein ODJ79_28765 [Actinoplanes sp. KI2]|uniref:hypothetical protein n=1 Tax=Actinoplanes sp. KI2 TaxID=2983315 RepID=UPI0021D5DCFD|nr:hypothetical protein [Actinoplanes sp. KI2]MCU7727729.1 hypothetical protein [Actinoplanes sp. KI2]